MQQTFLIKGRFHPAYSVYGRWLRRRAVDPRLAESRYVVRAAILALILIVAQIFAWGFGLSADDPLVFFGVQTATFFGYLAVVLIGFQPAIRIEASGDGLRLQQAKKVFFLSADDLWAAEVIDAQLFHRHYRRYAATHIFVNRIENRLLLIESTRGPVVLGLGEADRERLVTVFGRAPAGAYSSSSVA